jgi:serine protease
MRKNRFAIHASFVIATSLVSATAHAVRPTDPGLSYMDYLGAGNGGINVLAAWDRFGYLSQNPVTVAVIDTGATDHPDFSGRLLPGLSLPDQGAQRVVRLTSPTGQSADYLTIIGNTPVASGIDPGDVPDWNTNGRWHGTKVAGIIAAAANGQGVVGLAPDARILPVRVTFYLGEFSPLQAAQAIRWAAGEPNVAYYPEGMNSDGTYKGTARYLPLNPNPARVINVSLGGDEIVPVNVDGQWVMGCSKEYREAIAYANSRGAVVVVAAGNQSKDTSLLMPSACSGAIVVAALDRTGRLLHDSNYGVGVTIAAPGAGIQSTTRRAGDRAYVATYEDFSGINGTSFAAPLVSGAYAMLFGHRPQLSAAEATQILKATARSFPSDSNCSTSNCGAGILNVYAAMSELERRYPTPTCTLSASASTVAQGDDVALYLNGQHIAAGAHAYWYGTRNGSTDETGAYPVAFPGSYRYQNTPGLGGYYVRYAKIRGVDGRTLCTTNTVTVNFQTPYCALQGPAAPVAMGQPFSFQVNGNGLSASQTYTGYWYGTRNGVPDANGQSVENPFSMHAYTNQPGWAGTYTRYMEIYSNGQPVCTTNQVTAVLR